MEPARRGAYAARWLLRFHGNADFRIAIRTATFERGRIHMRVGAEIVAGLRSRGVRWIETATRGARSRKREARGRGFNP